MSLARAREKRDDARQKIADGIDPSELKKAVKTQRIENAANSFEAVCREWYAVACANKAESTREKTMTRLEKDVFP